MREGKAVEGRLHYEHNAILLRPSFVSHTPLVYLLPELIR